MSLRDALKVSSFNTLDFDFDELTENEVPFLKRVSVSAQEIRPLADPKSSEAPIVKTASSKPKSSVVAAGSSSAHVRTEPLAVDVDSDPEGKGVSSITEPKGLLRKRKTDATQIRSSISLPVPKLTKKSKNSTSHSSDNILTDLTEHLSGGNSSREEAAKARSAPTPTFFGGYLPVNETETMETEEPAVTSKGEGKTQGDVKVVTFSGTILSSSLGPDCFLDDEEDQVSSLPQSWFGPEVMAFFRYADVFSDDMEIDPATAEEKFVPDWDVRNKDSVMDELTARMWVEAESVKEDLEKETTSLKCKIQSTPDTEKKLAQLSQDLLAQKEKVKSLTALNQSSKAAAASASEERDKVAAELKSFVESSKEKDEEHKSVLAKLEEFYLTLVRLTNGCLQVRSLFFVYFGFFLYVFLTCLSERDAYKTGEANLKARMEEMKGYHKAEVEELKLESADLAQKVEDLQATKVWLLMEGARLLAKNIHKGPKMTHAVVAVNNSMSAIGVNSGVHGGYLHALKKKTPYGEVPLINRNAEAELNTAIACFDSLSFPVVNDLPNLVNEPLSKTKEVLFFAGESSVED
ncbi:hypothetical protein HanRHA438_Chr13g0581011 [Helianthus annuus]|nr:hypothetical protein HanIR_Chr13g0620471 [Helianthus annuus]KAJ0662420.1 hypothetical protein HanLR1_Chr13g0469221 [Helianthus annuus]KAJ0669949.1 hypothetical protein HanOQP8_Chr13g0468331 [Helianthus annuus]KAJ0847725.1 hypothetical protein HanPSC8_Chr13g0548541 [Helianthus annuus]KAJ0856671.1 hypothetical protein HanRHA438_Chr13g0581011 [Helianthus annuus]